MKNAQPIKTGKEIRTMYCLGCKDSTDNFKPQEKKRQIRSCLSIQ